MQKSTTNLLMFWLWILQLLVAVCCTGQNVKQRCVKPMLIPGSERVVFVVEIYVYARFVAVAGACFGAVRLGIFCFPGCLDWLFRRLGLPVSWLASCLGGLADGL